MAFPSTWIAAEGLSCSCFASSDACSIASIAARWEKRVVTRPSLGGSRLRWLSSFGDMIGTLLCDPDGFAREMDKVLVRFVWRV